MSRNLDTLHIQIIMSSLPAELESLVCSFLSIADLKTARQVNKRWAHITGPFLFEELWIAQPTLQNLEDVSCHDTLRFYVKKIVLLELPVPVIIPTAWTAERRLEFSRMSPEELAFKFPLYKIRYDAEQYFVDSGFGVAIDIVRRAVDKLPQLHGLESRPIQKSPQPHTPFQNRPSSLHSSPHRPPAQRRQ